MNQPEARPSVRNALAAIPTQRTAPDDLIGVLPVLPTVAGPRVAPRRWTTGRALLLPLGALYLYAATMLGLAALDRLVTGTAAFALLASPVVAVLCAVSAGVLAVTGARVVRGVLAR